MFVLLSRNLGGLSAPRLAADTPKNAGHFVFTTIILKAGENRKYEINRLSSQSGLGASEARICKDVPLRDLRNTSRLGSPPPAGIH